MNKGTDLDGIVIKDGNVAAAPKTAQELLVGNTFDAIPTNSFMLQCDDDFCPGSATTEGISSQSEPDGNMVKGACLKVAVGGWAQNQDEASAGRGLTVLDVGFLCEPAANVFPPALPGVVTGVDHDIQKQRFLSIDPNNPSASSRMRLRLLDNGCSTTGLLCADDSECKACVGGDNPGIGCILDSDCDVGGSCDLSGETCDNNEPGNVVLGWIGDPFRAGGDAPPEPAPAVWLAPVVSVDPGFRIWTETLVHITDCEVAPALVYSIDVEGFDSPGLFESLVMRTTPKPQGKEWGDLVGNFNGTIWSAPNNLVNVDDVNSMIKFLSLSTTAAHITVVDMVGSAPLYVNTDANASDLQEILKAFKGVDFPPPSLLIGGYPDIDGADTLLNCTGN